MTETLDVICHCTHLYNVKDRRHRRRFKTQVVVTSLSCTSSQKM